MSLIFHTRTFLFGLFFTLSFICVGQQKQEDKPNKIPKRTPKLGSLSVDYYRPFTTGDNFAGLGLDAKSGFNVRGQLYIYKNFFLGAAIGGTYLSVKDKQLVGNYFKTSVRHSYFSLGYELPLSNSFKLSASASFTGETNYRNKSKLNTKEAVQNDRGNVNIYQATLIYNIVDYVAFYINYSYRNDKLDIQTAPELQDVFNKASYHNIGIGIRFYFGNGDFISGF